MMELKSDSTDAYCSPANIHYEARNRDNAAADDTEAICFEQNNATAYYRPQDASRDGNEVPPSASING